MRELPGIFDVVVIGGGPTGIAAAASAARNGASTLLVERYGFLGGMATVGMVGPMMSCFAGDLQVVRGVWQDLVDRLIAAGGAVGHLKCPYDRPTTMGTGGYITPLDQEMLKYEALAMLAEYGCNFLFHASLKEMVKDGSRVVAAVLFAKGDDLLVRGRRFVDATGDGDVAYQSGVPYETGRAEDGMVQPMTLFARLGGVDVHQVKAYMENHPDDFKWHTFPVLPQVRPEGCTDVYVAGSGWMTAVRQALRSGELSLGRDRITFFSGLRAGEIFLNATRVDGDATDPFQFSRAEIEARKQVHSLVQFLRRHVPGFAKAYLISTAPQIGVRETRRIAGEYQITAQDVTNGTPFDDAIGHGTYPIDIHEPGGKGGFWKEPAIGVVYDFPYRSMLPKGVENLIVGGRCISASHEALGGLRVMVNCFALGQAAGTAAAMSVQAGKSFRELNVRSLQERLHSHGSFLRAFQQEDKEWEHGTQERKG